MYQIYGPNIVIKIMLMEIHGKFSFVDLINIKNQAPEKKTFHMRNVI